MDPLKVLIVDDDPMVAEINKSFTEAVAGFTVVGVAKNGREALELCAARKPDLVILDIYMPETDGLEVLASLRQGSAPVDVIMITAANDSATISKVLRCGIAGYIIKPFKFERYRAVLEAYRDFRYKAAVQPSLSQADLDAILAVKLGHDPKDIPKNFHVNTFNAIIDYLSRQTVPRSAEEVAQGTGVSRVTARRYLEYLVTQGQLQMVLEYLSVGRPLHRFKLKTRDGL
ncbi:response regulator [Sporolituus thermophilus]|uniref:Transcriptional regulatory protein n=1 Tax=Sporolituus thermophilus DSM 23256 TaxID=1123285 RepID=A0A1G7L9P4_9FIRM|nr:response regulator [Sporolituus thermophilus]SDF45739.1 two-component system, CitB family, response regulator DctR [Sporolituus thermophilus DSM 23256]